MLRVKLIFIFVFGWITALMPAAAQDGDVDWTIEKIQVTEAGPGTPVEGTRWSIGSQRDDILFIVHFDLKSDKTHGVWYGELRAKEKFYSSIQTLHDDGIRRNLKVDNARARGPDAEDWGGWKEGPPTVPVQSMLFDLDRSRVTGVAATIKLIVKYSPYDDKDNARYVDFPLDSFEARLDEVDADIAENGGGFFLFTRDEVEDQPLNSLPDFVTASLESELPAVSEKVGLNTDALRRLSMNDIKELLAAADKAKNEARTAEIRARHQAIYDQEPEWMDLNLCPKPDVSYCQNVGREAYSDDIFGDFTYGPIQGVVWRPEGSIIRIYAGIVEFDSDPEVVRAKKGAYYYIIKTEKGYLDLRGAEGMGVR